MSSTVAIRHSDNMHAALETVDVYATECVKYEAAVREWRREHQYVGLDRIHEFSCAPVHKFAVLDAHREEVGGFQWRTDVWAFWEEREEILSDAVKHIALDGDFSDWCWDYEFVPWVAEHLMCVRHTASGLELRSGWRDVLGMEVTARNMQEIARRNDADAARDAANTREGVDF